MKYEIKAGDTDSAELIISNDRAAQWLISLYVGEPFYAHQKNRIFESQYDRVFGREVTADKIYLAHLISCAIESVADKIEDPLIRSYQLTKFILLGIIGALLSKDEIGRKLLSTPELFIPQHEADVVKALETFAALLIPDLNYYIEEKKKVAGYYDYKSEFKNRDEYLTLLQQMERDYRKAIVKHPEESFDRILSVRPQGVA